MRHEKPAPRSAPLSREQLEEQLRKLVSAPPPQNLKSGAMCYRVAAPPRTVEYTCPVCAAKTSYSSGAKLSLERLLVWRLAPMRRAVREIANVTASLDERELCRACSPKAPDRPEVVLVVRHADGSEVRTRGVTQEDLDLLVAFTTGADRVAGRQGSEQPLYKKLPRLRRLLGLERQGGVMSWLSRLRALFARPEPPAPPVLEPPTLGPRERLEELGKEPVPDPEAEPRAMCYSVAVPPPVAEYVCPVCGSRTGYPSLVVANQLELVLPALRAELKQVTGLDVALDEREFCAKCRGPDGPSELRPTLCVRVPGAPEHRYRGVTVEDLQFVAGRARIKRKDRPRLEALIGRAAAEPKRK